MVKALAGLLAKSLQESLGKSVFMHEKFLKGIQGVIEFCQSVEIEWIQKFTKILSAMSRQPTSELCKQDVRSKLLKDILQFLITNKDSI